MAARAVGVGLLVFCLESPSRAKPHPQRNAGNLGVPRRLCSIPVALLRPGRRLRTVHRRGETAIGVAIATALMPPLATLGYSIAVARADYAFGALLLFLTTCGNCLAFAVVTRSPRCPFRQVRITRRLILRVWRRFCLGTPLALTLRRISLKRKRSMRRGASLRRCLMSQAADRAAQCYYNLQRPRVEAIVVS